MAHRARRFSPASSFRTYSASSCEAHADPHISLAYPVLMGLLWGIGGLTFGLAIRYLGLGLGYAIALGFCTAFGTIIPPIVHGQMGAIVHSHSGLVTLGGVARFTGRHRGQRSGRRLEGT